MQKSEKSEAPPEKELETYLNELASGDIDKFDCVREAIACGRVKKEDALPYLKDFFKAVSESSPPKYAITDIVEARNALESIEKNELILFRHRTI